MLKLIRRLFLRFFSSPAETALITLTDCDHPLSVPLTDHPLAQLQANVVQLSLQNYNLPSRPPFEKCEDVKRLEDVKKWEELYSQRYYSIKYPIQIFLQAALSRRSKLDVIEDGDRTETEKKHYEVLSSDIRAFEKLAEEVEEDDKYWRNYRVYILLHHLHPHYTDFHPYQEDLYYYVPRPPVKYVCEAPKVPRRKRVASCAVCEWLRPSRHLPSRDDRVVEVKELI